MPQSLSTSNGQQFHKHQQSNPCSSQTNEHKKTMTYDVGNPGPSLGQAQQYGGVKSVNGIQALSL